MHTYINTHIHIYLYVCIIHTYIHICIHTDCNNWQVIPSCSFCWLSSPYSQLSPVTVCESYVDIYVCYLAHTYVGYLTHSHTMYVT